MYIIDLLKLIVIS